MDRLSVNLEGSKKQKINKIFIKQIVWPQCNKHLKTTVQEICLQQSENYLKSYCKTCYSQINSNNKHEPMNLKDFFIGILDQMTKYQQTAKSQQIPYNMQQIMQEIIKEPLQNLQAKDEEQQQNKDQPNPNFLEHVQDKLDEYILQSFQNQDDIIELQNFINEYKDYFVIENLEKLLQKLSKITSQDQLNDFLQSLKNYIQIIDNEVKLMDVTEQMIKQKEQEIENKLLILNNTKEFRELQEDQEDSKMNITEELSIDPPILLNRMRVIAQYFTNDTIQLHQLNKIHFNSYKKNQKEIISQWMQNQKQNIYKNLQALLPIFQYHLNMNQSWQNLVNQINDKLFSLNNVIDQKFLFYALYIQSDNELQVRLNQLYGIYNNIPLIYCRWPKFDQEEIQYELNENIFYIIQQKIGIFSFGLGQSSQRCGKSQLINQIFYTNFSINNNNPFSYGSVDIDLKISYDNNCNFSLTDGHGIIKEEILKILVSIFQVIIIQISENDLKNPDHLQKILNQIENLEIDKLSVKILFFIRNYTGFEKNILFSTDQEQIQKEMPNTILIQNILPNQTIKFLLFNNLAKIDNQNQTFFYDQIRKFIIDFIQEYDQKPFFRQDTFLKKIIYQFNQESTIHDIVDDSEQFISNVFQYHGNFQHEEFLPFCSYSKQNHKIHLQKLDNIEKMLQITRQSELEPVDQNTNQQKQDNIQEMQYINKQQQDIQGKLNNITSSKILLNFIQILKSKNNYITIQYLRERIKSELLTQFQVCYRSSQQFHEYDQLNEIVHVVSSKNKTIEIQLYFGLLYKELLGIYEKRIDYFKYELRYDPFIDIHEMLIKGEIFEIIDYDNFQFCLENLKNILGKLQSKKVATISMIGTPQSGKQSILNYLFGTQFEQNAKDVQKSLCFSLVKVDQENIDYLIVLKSPGFQNSNNKFQQNIIEFCLTVSQNVICSIKIDDNQQLSQNLYILDTCIQTMNYIEKYKMQNPSFFLCFTNYGESNLEKQFKDELQTIITTEKQYKILNLDYNSIYFLENAFDKQNNDIINNEVEFNLNNPLNNFQTLIQDLSKKIILNMDNQLKNDTQKKTQKNYQISNWLEYSYNIWKQIDTQQDHDYLFQEQNLKLKLADIEQNHNSILNTDTQCQKYINQIQYKIVQEKIYSLINLDIQFNTIQKQIIEDYDSVQNTIQIQLEKYIKEQKFKIEFIDIYNEVIKHNFQSFKDDAESIIQLQRFKIKNEITSKYQEEIIYQFLNQIQIKDDQIDSKLDINFENNWNKIINDMKDQIDIKQNDTFILNILKKTYSKEQILIQYENDELEEFKILLSGQNNSIMDYYYSIENFKKQWIVKFINTPKEKMTFENLVNQYSIVDELKKQIEKKQKKLVQEAQPNQQEIFQNSQQDFSVPFSIRINKKSNYLKLLQFYKLQATIQYIDKNQIINKLNVDQIIEKISELQESHGDLKQNKTIFTYEVKSVFDNFNSLGIQFNNTFVEKIKYIIHKCTTSWKIWYSQKDIIKKIQKVFLQYREFSHIHKQDAAITQLDFNTYDFSSPEFDMSINLLHGNKQDFIIEYQYQYSMQTYNEQNMINSFNQYIQQQNFLSTNILRNSQVIIKEEQIQKEFGEALGFLKNPTVDQLNKYEVQNQLSQLCREQFNWNLFIDELIGLLQQLINSKIQEFKQQSSIFNDVETFLADISPLLIIQTEENIRKLNKEFSVCFKQINQQMKSHIYVLSLFLSWKIISREISEIIQGSFKNIENQKQKFLENLLEKK